MHAQPLTVEQIRRVFEDNFRHFLHKNVCCGYSLESPRRGDWQGDSNDHPQHMDNYRKLSFNYHQKPFLSVRLTQKGQRYDSLSLIELPLVPYIVCANGEGPGKTAQMLMLA